ncbi:energy transducer TonB [Halomonas sp. KO116]|uniref:energy transducer TonB n=1 Tax=Halomonas sp. KO116 TaxID=1504981 RepID=UPI0004E3DA01|nr:energy transducer TonB [Halomonas sp. KO116]AJY53325.1 TonB family protein [Halomonas sp. KO116]
MSLKSSLISGAILLSGIGAAAAYILLSQDDSEFVPPVIKTSPKHQMPDQYECITDDCWVYRENALHCASGDDHNRYLNGDESARCREETYICVMQDCTNERDIRSQQSFKEIVQSIGDRVWHTWSKSDPDDLSVRVRLILDEEGHVEETQLVESSGSSHFDEQAKVAILDTQPFYEIRTTSPETRALLTRIILSFGGIEVSTQEAP